MSDSIEKMLKKGHEIFIREGLFASWFNLHNFRNLFSSKYSDSTYEHKCAHMHIHMHQINIVWFRINWREKLQLVLKNCIHNIGMKKILNITLWGRELTLMEEIFGLFFIWIKSFLSSLSILFWLKKYRLRRHERTVRTLVSDDEDTSFLFYFPTVTRSLKLWYTVYYVLMYSTTYCFETYHT